MGMRKMYCKNGLADAASVGFEIEHICDFCLRWRSISQARSIIRMSAAFLKLDLSNVGEWNANQNVYTVCLSDDLTFAS
jgi:hypothetical protein